MYVTLVPKRLVLKSNVCIVTKGLNNNGIMGHGQICQISLCDVLLFFYFRQARTNDSKTANEGH